MIIILVAEIKSNFKNNSEIMFQKNISNSFAIYKKSSKTDINPELNIEKLKFIQEFYYFIHHTEKVKNKKHNIFNVINFDEYKETIYSLLENSRDLYISFNTDDLYNIEIINKKGDTYLLTTENKNFIDNILINFFNEVIDVIYEKQNINYYLDMYNL